MDKSKETCRIEELNTRRISIRKGRYIIQGEIDEYFSHVYSNFGEQYY